MQGYCAKCLNPVGEERYCPHCGYDRMQNLENYQDASNVHTTAFTPDDQQNSGKPTRPERQSEIVSSGSVTPPKRVRKLPFLLAGLVLAAAMFLMKEEEPVGDNLGPVDYTMPQFTMPEETTPAFTETDGWLTFSYTAPDLLVTQDSNGVMTVKISDVPIRDQYTVNRPDTPDSRIEYYWDVYVYSERRTLRVGTQYAKRERYQDNQTLTVSEMEHEVYVSNDGPDSGSEMIFRVFGLDVQMIHVDDSIAWQFQVPEYYPNNPDVAFPDVLDGVKGFRVKVYELENGLVVDREYSFGQQK